MKHFLNTIAAVSIALAWILFLVAIGQIDIRKYEIIAVQKVERLAGPVIPDFIFSPAPMIPPRYVFEDVEKEIKKEVAPIEKTPVQKPVSTTDTSESPFDTASVVRETNSERQKAGLNLLSENRTLAKIAEQKLSDLFEKQYFEHISPVGVGIEQLAKNAGYTYVIIGENLALGDWTSARGVVESWMGSPGHRANILKPQFTEIGVALRTGLYDGHKTLIAVQEFGTPQNVCTKVDHTESIVIETLEKTLSLLGTYLDRTRDTADASEYNAVVKEYEEMRATLNSKVSNYNNQVRIHNECLLRYR